MTQSSTIPSPVLAETALAVNLELEPEQVQELASLFKLLSDKTRLAIVQLLSGGEMNVSTLCRHLGLPQPTVSHHLGLLRLSHLIDNRRNGKQVFYRLNGQVCTTPGTRSLDSDYETDIADENSGVRIIGDGYSVHIIPGGECPEPRA